MLILAIVEVRMLRVSGLPLEEAAPRSSMLGNTRECGNGDGGRKMDGAVDNPGLTNRLMASKWKYVERRWWSVEVGLICGGSL